MRNRTYGGVRGRKTKVGEKLLRFPPTRLLAGWFTWLCLLSFSSPCDNFCIRREESPRRALAARLREASENASSECLSLVPSTFPHNMCGCREAASLASLLAWHGINPRCSSRQAGCFSQPRIGYK